MSIFFEIHQGIPREGPGSRASTRRAIDMLTLHHHPTILDIGCGPGEATLELARIPGASVLAVDTHAPFLDEVERRAESEGLRDHIKTQKASMFELGLPEESFDVIWSDGAIYIIGFEKGLNTWRPLLNPRGYMVVSELCWLTANPSAEARVFWEKNYPGIATVDKNIETIERTGYQLQDHFVLPESGWWDDYYGPLERRIASLRKKYADHPIALRELDEAQEEIDLYRKSSNEYGYVFYVMRKA